MARSLYCAARWGKRDCCYNVAPLQTGDYRLAIQDAEAAIPYADRSRDPLKGKVYQIMGEVYGRIAGNSQELQKKSLGYFDQVGRIVRKGNLEADGSFAKLDITSLYIERAEAWRLFKGFDDVHNALAIARDNLSPELTRWQIKSCSKKPKHTMLRESLTKALSSGQGLAPQ